MEPTFVELESGLVVCYLREDAEGRHAYKCFSPDEGTTWDGPYPTSLVVCRGRPQAGLLASGEVAITYGFGLSPRLLVLHVEIADAAPPELSDWTTLLEALTGVDPLQCPKCRQGRLVHFELLSPTQRAPPFDVPR